MPTGKVWNKIYNDLLNQITLQGSPKDRSKLLAELITPTERIMLAKRLAIICMLGEGYSFEDIQEILRVSPSTVGRVWQAIQKGKYAKIIHIVRKRKLAAALSDILSAFIPRPRSAPRWQFIDEIKFRGE
ncbi:MAG: Trp family transcriptional regulator [Patescibacteria group bacterium]